MAFQSLEDLLIQQTQKLQDLGNATTLIQSKSFIQDELVTAFQDVNNISSGIKDLKKSIQTMKTNNERCKELLTILLALDQQIKHMENNIPLTIQEYVNSEMPIHTDESKLASDYLNNTLINNTINNGNTTSSNHMTEGMKNCKKILFNEPDIPSILPVIEDEFSKIPKYIIGRYTLEALNNLISSINQIIKSKYSIINLGKNGARKKGELDVYLHYKKEQMSLGTGEENTYFFTSEDYEKYVKTKLDKTKLNLIIALRHCKRLREIRTAKTVNYALIIPNV
ncbi:spindle and kinetochore-associated protein 1-like [Phymastichus coffea]|uniref:spindle and kinetochore-associated protein 1-like n=1 Tax=Phymastichus coffea TaxID=108790 RepID=UPI00273AED57|nr:spindle and kinetochore-associated protein 1-like [Phymastichus coffea]